MTEVTFTAPTSQATMNRPPGRPQVFGLGTMAVGESCLLVGHDPKKVRSRAHYWLPRRFSVRKVSFRGQVSSRVVRVA
jgi:hypothetical protein